MRLALTLKTYIADHGVMATSLTLLKACLKTCPYISEPTLSDAELPLILALITMAPNGD